MTATGNVVYLPAIRPPRSLFAGKSTVDQHNTGARPTQPQRLRRIDPGEERKRPVDLYNAYLPVERAKGRLIDIFA